MACFSGISSLSRCEILALTNALAVALADGLNVEDLNALGTLLVAISSIILAFAALNPPEENNESSQAAEAPADNGRGPKAEKPAD